MFVSLNKKILYSILAFSLIVTAIFFAIFINLYSQNLQDRHNTLYMRNKYVVDLLNDNISLRKELTKAWEQSPKSAKSAQMENIIQGLNLTEKELSKEQKLTAELQRNYDNNREALIAGAEIIAFSLFLIILFIFLLVFLLDYWVIRPIEKLIEISRKVSMGILSNRININERIKIRDEFDILYSTFNNMLDNMEYNIEETKNRERFLQKLIDAIPDGIRVIDKNYNVIMANRAFHSLLKQKHSCIGEKCYLVYGYQCEGCQQRKYTCPIKQLLINKTTDELHTIHEIGKLPLYLNATRLRLGENDDNTYIVEALHDLSGDVQFSHQQKVSSLAFLSTSIAHEMKNNLGAIRMIFEGILENYYDKVDDHDDQKRYLQLAYNQLVETIKIPERLLRLAQFSDNEFIEINVHNAINDMLMMIDYDAKRRGIDVQTNLDKELSFIGNESDFKMIILNLTQNAIKAMPDGGTLRLTSYKNHNNIYINIEDTGTGIPSSKIKHIFEPFYSANNSSKSSGLGLAIVSSLIEKMKGRISVKSEEGVGTTFTIRIPTPRKNRQK